MSIPTPNKSLYVSNLSYNSDEVSLRKAFPGSVDAQIVRDRDTSKSKGFGFVRFESIEEAERALEQLGGIGSTIELDKRVIKINYAHNKEQKEGGGFRSGRTGGGGGGFSDSRYSDRGQGGRGSYNQGGGYYQGQVQNYNQGYQQSYGQQGGYGGGHGGYGGQSGYGQGGGYNDYSQGADSGYSQGGSQNWQQGGGWQSGGAGDYSQQQSGYGQSSGGWGGGYGQ